MKYLLDTNACIAVLNESDPKLTDRLRTVAPSQVSISAITAAELEFGVEKSERVQENRRKLRAFRRKIRTLPFDEAAAARYGEARAKLVRKGAPIGALDLLIAAHALAVDAVVVTANVREFARVPGLTVEDWTA